MDDYTIKRLIPSGIFIGYINGGSTLACILFFNLHLYFLYNYLLLFLFSIFFFFIGYFSIQFLSLENEDPRWFILDELATFSWGLGVLKLYNMPNQYSIFFLILFRFFDIIKPFYIKKIESVNGFIGIFGDDILAGFYSIAIVGLVKCFLN